MFSIPTFLFNYFDDCNACTVCHQLQENGFAYLTHEEDGHIIERICETIQMNLSLLSFNRESHDTNGPYDHNIKGHSYYHVLINISDNNCFTLINIYSLSRCSNTFQDADVLQPSLMITLGPHYFDKPYKYDQIHFPSQDSHLDTVILIENSYFQIFQGFREDCFEFYDPIYDFL